MFSKLFYNISIDICLDTRFLSMGIYWPKQKINSNSCRFLTLCAVNTTVHYLTLNQINSNSKLIK